MPPNEKGPKNARMLESSEIRQRLRELTIVVAAATLVIPVALSSCNEKVSTPRSDGESLSQPAVDSASERGSSPATVPDFRIEDYILEKPRNFETIMGTETQRGDCPDVEGGSRIDYERGYICTQQGVVVLVAYTPLRVPKSPRDGLSLVGLSTSTPPQHPGGTAYQWSQWGGNAIVVKGHPATRVLVNTSEQAPAIIVDMGRE